MVYKPSSLHSITLGKAIKQGLILGLLSIALHGTIEWGVFRYSDHPFVQHNRHWIVILTMLILVLLSYLIVRFWNNKQRPPFLLVWLCGFIIQLLTILSLQVLPLFLQFIQPLSKNVPDTTAIAISIDFADLLLKFFVFALCFPLIILSLIYCFDRKKS